MEIKRSTLNKFYSCNLSVLKFHRENLRFYKIGQFLGKTRMMQCKCFRNMVLKFMDMFYCRFDQKSYFITFSLLIVLFFILDNFVDLNALISITNLIQQRKYQINCYNSAYYYTGITNYFLKNIIQRFTYADFCYFFKLLITFALFGN